MNARLAKLVIALHELSLRIFTSFYNKANSTLAFLRFNFSFNN